MPTAGPMTKLIGDHLVRKGLITAEQLRVALDKQRLSGHPLGEVLVADGILTEAQAVEALSEQLGVPFVDVESYEIDKDTLSVIPERFLREHTALPLFQVNNTVTIAMIDPLDIRTVDRLRFLVRCEVEPVFGTRTAILKALDKYLGTVSSLEEAMQDVKAAVAVPDRPSAAKPAPGQSARLAGGSPAGKSPGTESASAASERAVENLASAAEKAPVIKLVDTILTQAVDNRASDIHFEPEEQSCHLRYRVDGILYDVPSPPKTLEAAIISRFKIMAGLDIAERRLPQDGRFKMTSGNKEVDFRISTFPTIYGENVVIRVLDKGAITLTMEQLGFSKETLTRFKTLLARPNGIILVTGPTGCGKTTTLYAALRTVDAIQSNVITLEDPVEYRIPRIRQSQIDVKAGLTFANGLRSIVRQDPDVIMIGEIRDLETAEIAIHAALTGHLVFSTLHTNDAPGAMTRLMDMGVEPFLVASSVIGVIAQRLVRTLCPCKERYEPTPEVLKRLGLKEMPKQSLISRVKGCDDCKRTGYRGRTGIYELLQTTETIRDMTIHKVTAAELRDQAVRDGMVALKEAGIVRVLEGVTTFEEVFRVAEWGLSE